MEEKEILEILVKNGVLKSTNKEEFFNLQLTRDGYTGTLKWLLLSINEIISLVECRNL